MENYWKEWRSSSDGGRMEEECRSEVREGRWGMAKSSGERNGGSLDERRSELTLFNR